MTTVYEVDALGYDYEDNDEFALTYELPKAFMSLKEAKRGFSDLVVQLKQDNTSAKVTLTRHKIQPNTRAWYVMRIVDRSGWASESVELQRMEFDKI
jgi:hypothetical protein